jgi:hypothetical protein
MCTFTLEAKHFIFNKCPIYSYTHDGASAKFITYSREKDYSVDNTWLELIQYQGRNV